MKILFFVSKFPCTSETFVLNQITNMIDRGHNIRIYSWGTPEDNCNHKDIENYNLISQTIYRDISIPQSHFIRLLKIIPYVVKMFLKYGHKVLRLSNKKYGDPLKSRNLVQYYIAQKFLTMDWEPDVIISHFGDNGIIITALRNAGIIPLRTKCFTYFHAHEICRRSLEETTKFYKPMFNEYDILLPINHLWRDKLVAAGANRQNVKVLHMGVDLKCFAFNAHNYIGDTMNILTVGRLCGQKGYEYAIRGVVAYAKMSKKNISYKIIGSGELENNLRQLVRSLNAMDYIHFLGAQPQQFVAAEMQKSNVFLLPSVTDDAGYMEGIPVALMEAMSIGVVCISTYHSGIPELITDGESGFLCKEKDPEGITNALLYIENLSNEQFNEIRENARDVIERDYDVAKETAILQELIKI